MQLDAGNLPALARGCAVLGAGGGGDPSIGLLEALHATEQHGAVPLVDLDDLAPDDLLMPCAGVGAPTVGIEKIDNGGEGERLRGHVEELFRQPVVALMSSEIGGSNGLLPIVYAARMGLPVVDADGMGRAFPEYPQCAMEIAGLPVSPCVMTDVLGNVVVFRSLDARWMERLARAAAEAFGGIAVSSEYILTVGEARTATVRGSLTLAIRIGKAAGGDDPLGALVEVLSACHLIAGKVVDVERHTTGGFVRGAATIEGLDDDAGREVRIEIQNENLIALEGGGALATVPDLITVLDTETADAITTERLRYGQRVTVIAFACDPLWRTAKGLELAGPQAFGYEVPYVPVEELHAGGA